VKVDCLHPKKNLPLKRKEMREVMNEEGKEVSQILLQQSLYLNL
jgi:hypothetical protein